MNPGAHIAEYSATPARRRTLLAVAINLIFFAGLIAFMFHVQAKSRDWPSSLTPPFEFGNLLMVFAMAMAGFCGSVTMELAAHNAASGKAEEAVRWVAIAISGWLVFLFLEGVEWANLFYLLNLGPKTAFGGTFLLLTGSHWLAVVACTIWFTFVVTDVRRRDILAAALYSHFLALWWIVVVIVLYVPNMNPLFDL
jgi:heme/copper-type cytochrome/quinol oxidase subunit 3